MLNISPGLMIWSLVNFLVFAFLIGKFAWKPMVSALQKREESIKDMLGQAERANAEAQRILKENEEKMASAQQEMMQVVRDGREQAQAQIQAAAAEAEKVKKVKLAEAQEAIEREKQAAMQQLRSEVSGLVLMATEKILKERLDADYQRKVVDAVIDDMPGN